MANSGGWIVPSALAGPDAVAVGHVGVCGAW